MNACKTDLNIFGFTYLFVPLMYIPKIVQATLSVREKYYSYTVLQNGKFTGKG